MRRIFLKQIKSVAFLLAAVALLPAGVVAQTWETDEAEQFSAGGTGPTEEMFQRAAAGGVESVKEWIAKGANVFAVDEHGMTALHWAARNGHLDIVTYLIEEKGLDANARTHNLQTPLHATALNCHLEVVQYLVRNRKSPADINAQDNDGETALHIAVEKGRLDIVRFLVENEASAADVWIKNNAKETPWQYAKKFKHPEIATYLRAQMDKNPPTRKVQAKVKKKFKEKTKKKNSKK